MNEAHEEAIFNAAQQLGDPARVSAYLDAACAGHPQLRQRIERLLGVSPRADEFFQRKAPPALERPLPPNTDGLIPSLITEQPGDRIGRYKLLEMIGEGGCGVVYMAEQEEPVRRRVALKIIKLGLETKGVIARFEAERQALALMDHPHIAKVFDGGVTASPESQTSNLKSEIQGGSAESETSNLKSQIQGGRPYFVMELVRGIRITDYCEQHNLPTRERLDLFIQVCSAIQHAHQKGVIHRDVKPSNVLVTENDGRAVPKVIDFGIAKATEQKLTDKTFFTQFAQFIGTPAYMSPEQTALTSVDIDTRSDIYSLGVLLYELLTGTTPFDAQELLKSGVDEMRRVIRETEPQKPSTRLATRMQVRKWERENVSVPGTLPKTESPLPTFPPAHLPADRYPTPNSQLKLLSTDLDWIVMKCLEKDRARRYETANSLAADIQRHLGNEPILARPPSAAYRFHKLVRRNQLAFAAATAVATVLVVGAFVSTWQAVRATRAQRVADTAMKKEADLRQHAETQELKARQFAYASDMNLAHQAVHEDDFYRALHLLDRHRPTNTYGESKIQKPKSEIDLRGWEWRYLWRQCQGEQRFILGEHTNGATAVGLLADGKTVFSAGRDKLVRLWDLESRRQIGVLPHAEEVIGAAASPDGRWLATATMKGPAGQPVLLWDLTKQKIAAPLTTTNFWLRPGSITFSPDSKWLAFATVFGGVRLWDVIARSEVTNLSASSISPASLGLAFSPDSRTLAYNENEHGAILLWDIASRSLERLTGHHDVVGSLAFSPDGRTLASGSRDRTARLWNLADRREGFRFNYSSGSGSLAFSPDGRTLAMSFGVGEGRVIRLIDLETGSQKAELRGHLKDVSSLVFTPDGQTLLSASNDGSLRVWGLAPRPKEKSAHPVAPDLSADWSTYGPALCLSPDGGHLLSVYTNQTFSLWDTLRLTEGERHPLPFTNTTIAAVASGGRLAAFANWRGEVMLWDVTTGQAQFFAQPITNRIHRLVFSLDGRYLAAANDTKALSETTAPLFDPRRTIRVWDVGNRRETHVLPTDGALPVSLTFSADAKVLIAGSSIGSVKLWPLDASDQAATFPGHAVWVEGLALLPDGQTLISAGTDIRFWDVWTRHETDKLDASASGFSCLALSPDGRRFAAGANGGLIMIWDVASHQEVATLSGHKHSVTQLAFTPDGDHLVSVSKDQLRVWRAAALAEAGTEKEARK